jgi:hypothetical protein
MLPLRDSNSAALASNMLFLHHNQLLIWSRTGCADLAAQRAD